MIKYFTRQWYHRKKISFLRKFKSSNLIWAEIEKFYFENTGKWLNWKQPKDINEKLMWLNRFWIESLKVKCTDKYLVREYVTDCGLSSILVPLLGYWDTVEEVEFEKLPNEFVIKCNHGSGYNIICLDKFRMDIEKTKDQLKFWMNEDYSTKLYEVHYKGILRRIIAEKLLSKTAPIEYQFWCINGKPESMLVCRKNFDGTYDAGSYSMNWERLNDRINEKLDVNFPKPSMGIGVLADYAEKLASPFPFVRVDFYVVNDNVYFAEMTFTPSANLLSNYKQSFLERLGNKLILPEIIN